MNPLPPPAEVLNAMITPAVLMSASGMLILSTSNRLARVVDRVRALAVEAERLESAVSATPPDAECSAKQALILDQLVRLSKRVMLLRAALTSFYVGIGLLVTTSIAIGLVYVVDDAYGWVPVVCGLTGACALLLGSIALVREAKLAVQSTLQEMAYVRDLVTEQKARHPPEPPRVVAGR